MFSVFTTEQTKRDREDAQRTIWHQLDTSHLMAFVGWNSDQYVGEFDVLDLLTEKTIRYTFDADLPNPDFLYELSDHVYTLLDGTHILCLFISRFGDANKISEDHLYQFTLKVDHDRREIRSTFCQHRIIRKALVRGMLRNCFTIPANASCNYESLVLFYGEARDSNNVTVPEQILAVPARPNTIADPIDFTYVLPKVDLRIKQENKKMKGEYEHQLSRVPLFLIYHGDRFYFPLLMNDFVRKDDEGDVAVNALVYYKLVSVRLQTNELYNKAIFVRIRRNHHMHSYAHRVTYYTEYCGTRRTLAFGGNTYCIFDEYRRLMVVIDLEQMAIRNIRELDTIRNDTVSEWYLPNSERYHVSRNLSRDGTLIAHECVSKADGEWRFYLASTSSPPFSLLDLAMNRVKDSFFGKRIRFDMKLRSEWGLF